MATPTSPDHFTTEAYTLQLKTKKNKTLEEFANFDIQAIDSFASPYKHYRMRAEFKVWHEGDTAYYAMHQPGVKNKPYIISEFPAASTAIQQRMHKLLSTVNCSEALKHKLFQVEFLTTTTDQCVISMIYHKPLDANWEKEALQLSHTLNTSVIGRSRKKKIVIGQDWVEESLTVKNKVLHYQQIENSFTQPNAMICQDMLEWSAENSKAFHGDLLELYCGNGNFSIALSENFDKILATEISKPSIRSATYNCSRNKVHNIDFIRMSSEELTDAINKVREFRRLKEINLDDYNFSTIFLDPPRAGLDENTRKLAANFENIIYISCNPDTLYRDLAALKKSHRVTKAALFDQFPYTEHRECGAILKKRPSESPNSIK